MFPKSKIREEPWVFRGTHISITEEWKVRGRRSSGHERREMTGPTPHRARFWEDTGSLTLPRLLLLLLHTWQVSVFRSFFQTRIAAFATCQAFASRNFFLELKCSKSRISQNCSVIKNASWPKARLGVEVLPGFSGWRVGGQ